MSAADSFITALLLLWAVLAATGLYVAYRVAVALVDVISSVTRHVR